jgi:uncharacterized protein YutE (UPF0331/DUF86 family)
VSREDELSATLAFELKQIQTELGVINRIAGKQKRLGRDEVQIRAAASSLQSIYNGIEKMIGLVLKNKGYSLSDSRTSHADLLVAARELGILSEALAGSLRELMAFRHFFRHSYGFMIDNELLNPLIQRIDGIVRSVAQELNVESGGA